MKLFIALSIVIAGQVALAGPKIDKLQANIADTHSSFSDIWVKSSLIYATTGAQASKQYVEASALLMEVTKNIENLIVSVKNPDFTGSPSELCSTLDESIRRTRSHVSTLNLIPVGDFIGFLKVSDDVEGLYCYSFLPDFALRKLWNYRSKE